MAPIFKLFFKKSAPYFINFKDQSPHMTQEELADIYEKTAEGHIQRETDLNKESIDFILTHVTGKSVLDIASGRGYLCKQLAKKQHLNVVGIDFVLPAIDLEGFTNLSFKEGNVEQIPEEDNAFDTVICAHTIEHVLNPKQAISELRRVAGKRLIVVLPRQRPYRYTFDLHLHFFPYEFLVKRLFDNPKGQIILCGGDWVYWEDQPIKEAQETAE
jgi:ubiquinone/menaquinone biosynthesis C-methylase UbiE